MQPGKEQVTVKLSLQKQWWLATVLLPRYLLLSDILLSLYNLKDKRLEQVGSGLKKKENNINNNWRFLLAHFICGTESL